MKILDKKITNKNFKYKQIEREGSIAIYEQSLIDPPSTKKWYEVIVIRSHDGYEIAGNKVAPSEMYPSANHWGTLGWTCSDLETAKKKFNKLVRQESKKLKS